MKKLHISLFSGISSFDVAAELAGWENVASCEINEFGNFILNEKWPNAYHHKDIHTFTFQKLDEELTKRRGKSWRTNDIVLTGGFPCQPYSSAGKRKGTEDERHLWPEMLRAIREIAPRWVVGENVFGLTNWNGGLVFEEVQTDLEAEGYEVQPYILPASGVNAPHQRYRVWFVAHSDKRNDGRGSEGHESKSGKERVQERDAVREPSKSGGLRFSTNAKFKGLEGTNKSRSKKRRQWKYLRRNTPRHSSSYARSFTYSSNKRLQRRKKQRSVAESGTRRDEQPSGRIRDYWRNFPTQPPVRTGDDGFRTEALRQRIRKDCMGLLSEKEIDTIISKATSRWVKETIKAGGNAVVPPLVTNIFNTINKYDETRESAGMGSSCDECDKASGKGKIFF